VQVRAEKAPNKERPYINPALKRSEEKGLCLGQAPAQKENKNLSQKNVKPRKTP